MSEKKKAPAVSTGTSTSVEPKGGKEKPDQTKVKKRKSKKFTYQAIGGAILVVIGVISGLVAGGIIPWKSSPTPSTDKIDDYVAPTKETNFTFNLQMNADADWIVIRGECGMPRERPQVGKIVGGAEAVRHSWPWQVGILRYMRYDEKTQTVKATCGGTLVGPKYVITATHCFLNTKQTSVSSDKNAYRVLIGAHKKGQAVKGARMIEIRSVHHHPRNNAATFSRLAQLLTNDITVVVLKTIVDPNIVSPVTGFACLPMPGIVPPPGKKCWATGWGSTMGSGANKLLKQVQQPVVSEYSCRQKYGTEEMRAEIHLCAGPDQGYMGTCQGDSGGPLVCEYSDGSWVLHGATSFGPQPCGTNPAVWAQVSHYMSWICCFLSSYGPCREIKCVHI